MKNFKTRKYKQIKNEEPPENTFVHTKIDDEHGERNKQIMKLSNGLWFTRDGMYVYYKPTHWAYMETNESLYEKEDYWYCK